MPRARKLTLAAALAAGVAAYATPAPVATTLRAEQASTTGAVVVAIPPRPDDEPAVADGAPEAGDDVARAIGDQPAEAAGDPIQLADATPFAGRTQALDPDWRITVRFGEADRCALSAGDDCSLLAIRHRIWDFAVELGDSDDEPLIAAATPVEADGEPARAAAPAAAAEDGAAAAARVIAPPPAVGRIAPLRVGEPAPVPRFTIAPPAPPEEPRRRPWWRSARAAMQVAPNTYLDVANIVGPADPPRQARATDGTVTTFEGGAQETATSRLRFGLSIPLEALARNREHRGAAPLPPGFAGPQN